MPVSGGLPALRSAPKADQFWIVPPMEPAPGQRQNGWILIPSFPRFESWRLSQPVRSLRRCFRMCENHRHFRELGRNRPVSSWCFCNNIRAFDEKVESMMGDSHGGANRIQDPHWNKGASHEWGSLIPTICVNVSLRQSKPVIAV